MLDFAKLDAMLKVPKASWSVAPILYCFLALLRRGIIARACDSFTCSHARVNARYSHVLYFPPKATKTWFTCLVACWWKQIDIIKNCTIPEHEMIYLYADVSEKMMYKPKSWRRCLPNQRRKTNQTARKPSRFPPCLDRRVWTNHSRQ